MIGICTKWPCPDPCEHPTRILELQQIFDTRLISAGLCSSLLNFNLNYRRVPLGEEEVKQLNLFIIFVWLRHTIARQLLNDDWVGLRARKNERFAWQVSSGVWLTRFFSSQIQIRLDMCNTFGRRIRNETTAPATSDDNGRRCDFSDRK